MHKLFILLNEQLCICAKGDIYMYLQQHLRCLYFHTDEEFLTNAEKEKEEL